MRIFGQGACELCSPFDSFPFITVPFYTRYVHFTRYKSLTHPQLKTSFHCLFCHGYEERGSASAGVLASGLLSNSVFAAPISRMANRLASSVNVYTNGNEAVAAEVRTALKSTKNFRIENRRIKSLANDPDVDGPGGVLVTLEDGTVNKEGFIVSMLLFPYSFQFLSLPLV
jgi:hypothetical protein